MLKPFFDGGANWCQTPSVLELRNLMIIMFTEGCCAYQLLLGVLLPSCDAHTSLSMVFTRSYICHSRSTIEQKECIGNESKLEIMPRAQYIKLLEVGIWFYS